MITCQNIFKFIAFLFVTLWHSNHASGQDEGENKLSPYLFEEFSPATILFKNGSVKQAQFNYNMATEEMVYVDNGKFMALEMPGIDTIFVNSRKFMPFSTVFYEVVNLNPGSLFIRHQILVIDKGKPIGYGSYTQTSATNSIKNISSNGTLYNLEVPAEYITNNATKFMFKLNGKAQFHDIKNARQVQRIFPAKKEEISAFIMQNKTDFTKYEDVMKLLQILP